MSKVGGDSKRDTFVSSSVRSSHSTHSSSSAPVPRRAGDRGGESIRTISSALAVLCASLAAPARADSLDGLTQFPNAESLGPSLRAGAAGYSAAWYDGSSIRVVARTAAGLTDTSDCPAGSVSLGMPTLLGSVTGVSQVAIGAAPDDPATAIALVAVDATVPGAGAVRKLYWKEHSWSVHSTCGGWSAPWQELSTIGLNAGLRTAPAAMGVESGNLVVVVVDGAGVLRYRTYNSYAGVAPGDGTWTPWDQSAVSPCCRGSAPSFSSKPALARSGEVLYAVASRGAGINGVIGVQRIDSTVTTGVSRMAFVNFTPPVASGSAVISAACGAAARGDELWLACAGEDKRFYTRRLSLSSFAAADICTGSESAGTSAPWAATNLLGSVWVSPTTMFTFPTNAAPGAQFVRFSGTDLVTAAGGMPASLLPLNMSRALPPGAAAWQ